MDDENENLFYETFVGELVEVTTTLMVEAQEETEEGMTHVKSPLTLQGYLVDVDSKYYYLGDTPDKVRESIRKDIAVRIVMMTQIDHVEELLKSIPTPEDENQIN